MTTNMPNFDKAKNYFEKCLTTHGATAHGVDWPSEKAQELRFSQLLKVIDPSQPFSLLDYGCGYGALLGYLLRERYPMQQYVGFDLLESMTEKGRELFAQEPHCQFTSDFASLSPVDYGIASGIFNLKLETPFEQWTEFVISELHKMNALSQKGFSANFLTKYSDADHMKGYLYYADPCFLFDYCKRNFSRNVALLHDYEMYDFTIIVRKASA